VSSSSLSVELWLWMFVLSWAFDDMGTLSEVPSNKPGVKLPSTPMRSYLVEEKGGFVWFFFGDASVKGASHQGWKKKMTLGWVIECMAVRAR
jgi:hypothetical protein